MLSHILDEGKQATVGRRKAYKDQPHFHGDEYHGHCELPGGKEVSWTMTGKRRHPNKFPADDKIPKDAKLAVAKVLGVDPNILETYWGYDEIEGKNVFIIQESEQSLKQYLQEIQE